MNTIQQSGEKSQFNIQDRLKEALVELESINIDEFEARCIAAGLKPKRKQKFKKENKK